MTLGMHETPVQETPVHDIPVQRPAVIANMTAQQLGQEKARLTLEIPKIEAQIANAKSFLACADAPVANADIPSQYILPPDTQFAEWLSRAAFALRRKREYLKTVNALIAKEG